MMVLIRLSEIFIITGIFRGTLGTITQQIVIFINILSKFFKYTPFGPLYLLKVKSLLGPMPGIFLASLPSLKTSLYSDCEWINLLLIEYVSLLQRGENLRQMLLMEPSRARFLLVCSHPSPPSLPRWFLPFHRRIFSSCDRQAFYKQIMSFSLTLFETWMSESLEEKNGVVVVSQRPLENDLTFTPHLGQNLKWMRTEWTWTQCIHVWCFGWHGSWIGTKMMYCLCGPPNTSVLNTQIETRSDYRET